MNPLLFISFIIIISGVILIFVFNFLENILGSLTGKIIYHDATQLPGKTLRAKTLPLIGKPDYILKENGEYLPLEFKSGKTPKHPYSSHKAQLMAYCLLIEENYHHRPSVGILKYPQKEFRIKYTIEEESLTRRLVNEIIHLKISGEEPHCDHPQHNVNLID